MNSYQFTLLLPFSVLCGVSLVELLRESAEHPGDGEIELVVSVERGRVEHRRPVAAGALIGRGARRRVLDCPASLGGRMALVGATPLGGPQRRKKPTPAAAAAMEI